MNTRIYCTKNVYEEMQQDTDFSIFVHRSLKRFFSGNWGNVCAENEIMNQENPLEAMGAYNVDGRKIWIKRDNDLVTVLFPSEW